MLIINPMRVAITGASGFVGQNLIAAFNKAGIATVPISRRPLAFEGARPSPHLDRDTDPAEWAHIFTDIDMVVHCAARAHVMKEHAADPLDTFRRVNRDGSMAMARGAAAAGVRRIVFLSSVKVMGESTSNGRPFRNGDPIAPEDPYAISKAEAENVLEALSHECGFELVVLRPPLVYGPNVGGNIASLIRLIRRGLWLPLGAARHNRRSMISTSNLADAVLAALAAPGAAGGRFLVSDGEDLSTRDLVLRLAAALGRPARLLPIPPRPLRLLLRALGREALWSRLFGDLQVDISATCERLAWSPRVSVGDGFAEIAALPQRLGA